MKAAENFEQETSVEEVLDEKLFIEFMKKVPIWDYFAISKQVYLSMSEKEKRDKISKYYSDMKSRQSNGKSISFLFVCLIIWNMPLKSEGLLIFRERLERSSKDASEYIFEHCFYCKKCCACSINSSLAKELKRNKFKTDNKKAKWWRLYFDKEHQVILLRN